MKRTIALLSLVGVMAFGSTFAAFAATGDTKHLSAGNVAKAVEQTKYPTKERRSANESDEAANVIDSSKATVTSEQAKKIALNAVMNGSFKDIQLEDENGVLVYGVEVQAGTHVQDVKVNAVTGTIESGAAETENEGPEDNHSEAE